jgi:hypothetical protein
LPKSTDVGLREKEKDAPGTVTIAIVRELAYVGSATNLAVTVTVSGLGTVAGAEYFPVASMVPQLAPEQPVPATLQVTPWLLARDGHVTPIAQDTLAPNCPVPPI